MAIGGKWAISWKIAAYTLPFLLVIIPISEGAVFTWWAFWRWTLVSFISLIPVVIIFFIADITIFKGREKNPVPDHYVFILGFILGFTRGGTAGIVAYYFNALQMDNFNAPATILLRAINAGFIGMIAIPLMSLIASSIEIYQSDRNALIAERLLAESQKSESAAVIKSLRSSMTRRVDENLLEVVKNSQEYRWRQIGSSWLCAFAKQRWTQSVHLATPCIDVVKNEHTESAHLNYLNTCQVQFASKSLGCLCST